MSDREQIQNQIATYLNGDLTKWNAPYGVITGMQTFGKGKCRTVTFGIALYLDATCIIYGVNNISINGQGALAYKYAGHFTSVEQVIEKLKL